MLRHLPPMRKGRCIVMRNYVEKIELENYWKDEPIDPLVKKLDEIIEKGNKNVSRK